MATKADDEVPAELVRRGHFIYESGHHGDTWLDLDSLLADPGRLHDLAQRLAGRLAGRRADLVCGPLEGGAFVGQLVAACLGTRFAYARRAPASEPSLQPRYAVPSGFELSGRRAAIVDDAINVGSAAAGCLRELNSRGAEVVALASVFVCAPAGEQVGTLLGVPQVHLFKVPTSVWIADECPLCRRARG